MQAGLAGQVQHVGLRSSPVGAKSRPWATRRPSTRDQAWRGNEATVVGRGLVLALANIGLQVPVLGAGRNAIRSRSRSTTSRVATDWTRPADSCGMTFFHSTGETS